MCCIDGSRTQPTGWVAPAVARVCFPCPLCSVGGRQYTIPTELKVALELLVIDAGDVRNGDPVQAPPVLRPEVGRPPLSSMGCEICGREMGGCVCVVLGDLGAPYGLLAKVADCVFSHFKGVASVLALCRKAAPAAAVAALPTADAPPTAVRGVVEVCPRASPIPIAGAE